MYKNYYVYLLANEHSSVLYVGVTNDLVRRVFEHKNKIVKGFTAQYNVNKLVFFEITNDVYSAISREKQIKSWSRKRKNDLVSSKNPGWVDLYENL